MCIGIIWLGIGILAGHVIENETLVLMRWGISGLLEPQPNSEEGFHSMEFILVIRRSRFVPSDSVQFEPDRVLSSVKRRFCP